MSVFDYPTVAHIRRHGPTGYSQYSSYKDWLRDEFSFRCVYCLVRERWQHSGNAVFGVDHIAPKNDYPERTCDYDNLLYACNRCNSAKGAVLALDPCHKSLGNVLRIEHDGMARSLCGSHGDEIIEVLALNDIKLVDYRRMVVALLETLSQRGLTEMLDHWLAYPLDLPNLTLKNCDNLRPAGVRTCFYVQRVRGELPTRY